MASLYLFYAIIVIGVRTMKRRVKVGIPRALSYYSLKACLAVCGAFSGRVHCQ